MSVTPETESCRACGAGNPAGARFCGSCGANLAAPEQCPACGAENPAGQAFCNSCGARLAAESEGSEPSLSTTHAEADGERKQVTVLFADVKGSMNMAEQVDPDEWRQIMQRFFSLLSDGVRRFEGTVDKFTGDGIMALFGAPIAHEDHAARACFAALSIGELVAEYATELRRARGMNFSVRIGINSGEVVAGAIGMDSELEYTAVGHTVGLAQRMEALAEPGKAYLTEHTAKLAEGYLELKDLGEFEVKGASRPIRVFELVGAGSARSRFDLSRERGLSRFVGRAEETKLLAEALEQAKQGRGGVIGVVADPGIGKSRLCQEFADRCRADGIDVYETQAQAHGTAIPFLPVLHMMRGYFGIEDRDSERVAREKIAGRLLLLDPDFSDDLPLVFDFLGVPDPERPAPQVSGEARQRLLRGVIKRLYRTPGRTDVVVNVMEDLHWMDEGSEQIVAEVVSAVEGTATLALVNFRPEYQAEWTDSPIYRRIPLLPLGPESTAELLADLAGTDPSLDGLAELIHERTGGNPFFIEEMVRELVEAGYLEGERGGYRLTKPVDDTGVPATVQAILAARIDRLETAKALLQAASVIGKEVPEPALRIVAGVEDDALAEGLKELIGAGFLYEAEIYPERVLAFSHPLTQEVAYGSQLGEQRAKAHAAAARAMIELNPERHDELAALIAQHLELGGETLEAARWNARAAHWAGYGHPRDAMRLWAKVSELAAELPEDEETSALAVFSRLLQLDYAWRLGMDQKRVDTLLGEAKEIATRLGDLRSLTLLKMMESVRPGLEQDAETWTSQAADAIALADRSGDDAFRVAIRTACSYSYLCAGDWAEVERLLDEALEIAGDDRGAGVGIIIGCPVAWALMGKGVLLRERGELDEAYELCEAALRIAAEQGDPETEGWTRGSQVTIRCYRGETSEALALAERNYELTERLGDVFSRTWALVYLGIARVYAEEFEGGLEALERAERLYREAMGKGGEAEAWRAAFRAEALLGLGRTAEALATAEGAASIARERGMKWSLPRAARILGRARTAAGKPGAEEAFEEGAAAAREVGLMVELEAIEEDRRAVAARLT
ncbi:MAG TPA: adenylate/guanylate cyclase domain-containing protein [Solirubrobacterales bacterium]